MAIDLFCHSSMDLPQVQKILTLLKSEHENLFLDKFLIGDAKLSNQIKKEAALEHGLQARSFFLVGVNDKNATNLLPIVITILKKAIGDSNLVIMLNDESRR